MFTERKNSRLKHFDYSTSAAYFVTICVDGRDPCLSSIDGSTVELTALGGIVQETWASLHHLYPYVVLDASVSMPDHFHGILMLLPSEGTRKPLPQLMGAFKTMSTKRINVVQGTPGLRFWKRSFYERVLRNDFELEACREYIVNNPLAWSIKAGVAEYPWAATPPK